MSSNSCSNAAQRPERPRGHAPALRRAAALGSVLAATLCVLALPAGAMPGRPSAQDPSVAAVAAGWRQDLTDVQTVGEGDWRWWGLRIYHARLIAGRLPLQADAPFALELTYYRSISREHIVAASLEEMQRLAAEAPSAEQMAAWRRTLEHCFVDVREGDRLTGVYLPGHGARFYRGEALLADVDDDGFARAFFAIWLDPRARDARLRARLLGARD